MHGPDLSHLLDGASSEKPSFEVLEGIVRRQRRLKARRARAVATLGLVIALAGLGVGIAVSQRGTTATALGGAGATSTTPQPGKARAGTSTSMRPSMGVEVPAVSSTTVPRTLHRPGGTYLGRCQFHGRFLRPRCRPRPVRARIDRIGTGSWNVVLQHFGLSVIRAFR